MKTCTKCGTEKPVTEFYAHPKRKDGAVASCKDCCRANAIRVRNEKIEYYREYDRKRANDVKRVEGRKAYAESPSGLAGQNKAKRAYLERNPVKRSAHTMVGNAVRGGILAKSPCEVCGATTRVHGHHDDYAKPLDVRWLCPKHHAAWHKENKSKFGGTEVDF